MEDNTYVTTMGCATRLDVALNALQEMLLLVEEMKLALAGLPEAAQQEYRELMADAPQAARLANAPAMARAAISVGLGQTCDVPPAIESQRWEPTDAARAEMRRVLARSAELAR